MTTDAVATPTKIKRGRKSVDVNRYFTATQFQLIWWRFRKHRLAMIGSVVLAFYLLMVVFAEIIAPYGTQTRNSKYLLGQPQPPRFVDSDKIPALSCHSPFSMKASLINCGDSSR
jgi:peptide/nickel transport system permease protein